ncbi:hypothetical protein [Emticicia sp. SJ17W-69]|uniref:hypothetical protein n=1 Tax=Emticicia sp. SJ17W-69 TaxID=3421657 RepID=UPI003EBD5617
MFTFLEFNNSFSNIVMIYPLQFLLVGFLLSLGLYELFHTLGIGRNFNRGGEPSKKIF